MYVLDVLAGKDEKMIDIPLQNLGDMPCYDQNIVCYAMAEKRRYEMIFAGAWGFEFREEEETDKLGEKIKSRTILNMNYLKRYHGIDVYRSEVTKEDDFIGLLEEEIEKGNPVMVFVTPYYFPWNEHYRKFDNHLYHALMVVGVDREKSCVYCLDNMYKHKNAELSFEDFLLGNNGKYWIFSCVPEYEKKVDVEEMIQYCLRKLRRNTDELKDIQDIRRFADAMEKNFNLKREIDNKHGGIWIEPIIFNIGGILADRLDYSRLLTYVLEQKEDENLLLVKEQMDKMALAWNQIRGMLIKGYYLENPTQLVKRVIKRIRHVADLEEETAHIYENWQQKRTDARKKKEEPEMQRKFADIQPISLENYYNNQCFGVYMDRDSVADIPGMNYFFLVDDKVKQKEWKHHGMRFTHAPVNGREQDSIRCDGQVIPGDSNIHDSILLMGYGDLCSFQEEIEICYEDGSSDTIPIVVPDATIPNPFIKDTMIWNGRCGLIDDIEEHLWEVGMYARAYEIQKKPVKQIKLPVCPNVILFAVSFGTYEME